MGDSLDALVVPSNEFNIGGTSYGMGSYVISRFEEDEG